MAEFLGCNRAILDDMSLIERGMANAVGRVGAIAAHASFEHFSALGISGVVILQEGHVAIHTWPEYQYAACDLFTSGDTVDPWPSFDHLKEVLEAENYSAFELRGGELSLREGVDVDLCRMREDVEKHLRLDKLRWNEWFTDKDEDQALSLRYTGGILFERNSQYQKVRVINTHAYGKALIVDSMVMCTERDERHYHEMISHPAILGHGQVRHVLVVGGGDGGTIREVLKHDSVERVVMVEIDRTVIEASKLHLPELSVSFDHPKLDLRIGDGVDHVANIGSESYDIIIVDGSDPKGPAARLFSDEFLQNCKRALRSNGLLVAQGESPFFNREMFIELNGRLKGIFGREKVRTLLFHIPTYPSGIWSFQLASKGTVDPRDVDPESIALFERRNPLHYYNDKVHKASFALPNYLREMLNE